MYVLLLRAALRIIHMPPVPDSSLALVEALKKFGRKVNDPSMHGGRIDVHAPLSHHFFQIAKAQIVG